MTVESVYRQLLADKHKHVYANLQANPQYMAVGFSKSESGLNRQKVVIAARKLIKEAALTMTLLPIAGFKRYLIQCKPL